MTTGITVYGCGPDEAASFRRLARRYGVNLTITAAAASEANAELATGHRCISVGHQAALTGPALLELSRVGVRYVSTRSIGYDHIDVDYARGVGIAVGNVTYAPDGVADYTLMLILMVLRHARTTIRRTDVHDYRLAERRGRDLRDLTVGVVGTGRIGTAVVERLRGFGCRIVTHDRHPMPLAEHLPLEELLRQSDVVTLHTPLSASTHHLLDRRRIAQMKYGACVVNTGRGALLDTAALVRALERGRLGGAALDVLEGEEGVFYADCRDRPVPSTLIRLQQLPNVLVTAHTAYYTERALSDTVENSLISCLEFEKQEEKAWIG